jgi:hypothetical protein
LEVELRWQSCGSLVHFGVRFQCKAVSVHSVGQFSERPLPKSAARAGKECGIGHIGTHTFRHSYRMWIDAVGTPIGVQQKLMRHADIRTTMNIYGDVVTNEMSIAVCKIARLAFPSIGAQAERNEQLNLLKNWLLR